LIAVPANGGDTRELASVVLAASDFICISPARKDILFVKGAGRETWTNKQLVVADPVTGVMSSLTGEQSVALSPSWSADGRKIAYVGSPDNRETQHKTTLNQRRIWLIEDDGSRRQLVADSKARDEFPLWAKDGQSLIFIRVDQNDKSSVWNVGVDKGTPQKLVDDIDMPDTGWFGFYGRMDWYKRLAWFR
jgi:Tol biopolymer transport system component